jgi:SAM-dependent methyltransferase
MRRDLDRAFELVELVLESGATLQGAQVLEVGTGWRPVVPFVVFLGGASKVVTVDVNPWLTLAYARETWLALEPFLDEIADRCGTSVAEVRSRYARLSLEAQSVQQFLAPAGIDYRYPADARSTGLPERSMDLVVSSNVLEHIPADIQLEIHRESRRILKPGGLAVHRFNPQDHYSTVDRSITFGNFLQYSKQEWHWYGGSGLAYHNRLRSRDYRDLFQQAGFESVVDRQRVDQRTLQAIQTGTLKVHEEFSGYTPEELSVDYMWLSCRKPWTSDASSDHRPVERNAPVSVPSA